MRTRHEAVWYHKPRGVMIVSIGYAIDGERETGSHACVLSSFSPANGPCPPDFPNVADVAFKAVDAILGFPLAPVDERAIRGLADTSPCSRCGGTGRHKCSYCEGKRKYSCDCHCGNIHEADCGACDETGESCDDCLKAEPFRFKQALYDRKLLAIVVRGMMGAIILGDEMPQFDKCGAQTGFGLILESANGARGCIMQLSEKPTDYPVLK